MKKMWMLVMLFWCCVATICLIIERPREDYTRKVFTELDYVRDAKTGMCFAVSGWSHTWVPCEPVERFIKK